MSELPYTSLPSLRHFEHESLVDVLRDSFARQIPDGRGWLAPQVDRKSWEVAMAIRALKDHGAVHEAAEVLGVGAGHEATAFLLTRHCRRVFATDLYVDPGSWERTANLQILTDPARFFGGDWNPRRLVVQHMDALDLRFEDDSFDGIFSSSSIEHFGDHASIRRSAEEMCRVLRPGGICSISTEFRLDGAAGFALPDTYAFTQAELFTLLIDDLPWEPIGCADLALDEETAQVTVEFDEAAEDVRAGRGVWSTYPHLVLEYGEHRWTSVHLALRKQGGPSND